MEKGEGRPKLDVTCLVDYPLQPGHKTPSKVIVVHFLVIVVHLRIYFQFVLALSFLCNTNHSVCSVLKRAKTV